MIFKFRLIQWIDEISSPKDNEITIIGRGQ